MRRLVDKLGNVVMTVSPRGADGAISERLDVIDQKAAQVSMVRGFKVAFRRYTAGVGAISADVGSGPVRVTVTPIIGALDKYNTIIR
jgi:hypothetical protein